MTPALWSTSSSASANPSSPGRISLCSYNTSNIMHHYGPEQHVAAALALFASVALWFWYVLLIVMALSHDDRA